MPPHSSGFHSMWTSFFQEFCIAQGLSPCVRSRPSGSDLSFSRLNPEILVFLAVRFPAAFFRVPSTPCPFLLQDGHFSLSAVLLQSLPPAFRRRKAESIAQRA